MVAIGKLLVKVTNQLLAAFAKRFACLCYRLCAIFDGNSLFRGLSQRHNKMSFLVIFVPNSAKNITVGVVSDPDAVVARLYDFKSGISLKDISQRSGKRGKRPITTSGSNAIFPFRFTPKRWRLGNAYQIKGILAPSASPALVMGSVTKTSTDFSLSLPGKENENGLMELGVIIAKGRFMSPLEMLGGQQS